MGNNSDVDRMSWGKGGISSAINGMRQKGLILTYSALQRGL